MSQVISVNEVLVRELQRLLEEVAPEESDLASVQVWGAGQFHRHILPWEAFGPSGGGTAALLAPRILTLLIAIARGNLPGTVPHEAVLALEQTAGRLAADHGGRVRFAPASRTDATVAAAAALAEFGWDVTAAQRAAEQIVIAGERVAAAVALITEMQPRP
jgi:hypothetical protein